MILEVSISLKEKLLRRYCKWVSLNIKLKKKKKLKLHFADALRIHFNNLLMIELKNIS